MKWLLIVYPLLALVDLFVNLIIISMSYLVFGDRSLGLLTDKHEYIKRFVLLQSRLLEITKIVIRLRCDKLSLHLRNGCSTTRL